MAKAKQKRWEAWENECVQKACEQKIRLTIIATGLERSIDSVNKKVQGLGLREVTSLEHPKNLEKQRSAIKMKALLKIYAPLKETQTAALPLKEAFWTNAKPLEQKRDLKPVGKPIDLLKREAIAFSYRLPLKYVLSKDSRPKKKRKEKAFGEPFYVPLTYVEEWAVSEGFRPVTENLQDHGFSFWKEGKHYSSAQLLIYINSIRFERKLQPLAIYQEVEA